MHPRIGDALSAVVIVVAACSSRTPEVDAPLPVDVSPSAEPVHSAVSPDAIGSVPTTASGPVATAPRPGEGFEARFLPLDARCEKDADCAVTKRGVGERLFCCDACDAVAGGKAWVARADLRCSAYDKEPVHHVCPPRDCAAPPGARCNHGACELALPGP